jgi:hypothetical protein
VETVSAIRQRSPSPRRGATTKARAPRPGVAIVPSTTMATRDTRWFEPCRPFELVTGGDDPFEIRHDPTVVEKQIDVVLRGEERARVPLQHEVGPHGPLDRLHQFRVGGVDHTAKPAADRPLPVGERVDVVVDTGVGLIARLWRGHGCQGRWPLRRPRGRRPCSQARTRSRRTWLPVAQAISNAITKLQRDHCVTVELPAAPRPASNRRLFAGRPTSR